jgi:hypothetical protein
MELDPTLSMFANKQKFVKKILHNTSNFLAEDSVQKILGPLFTHFYSKIVPLQPSLLFLGKVGAYPRVESPPVAGLLSIIGSWPYAQYCILFACHTYGIFLC